MQILPYLPDIQYGLDDGFSTVIFSLFGSCIGGLFIFLLSFFELKLKSKIASFKFKQIL